jgi:GNAT superfamily N-acetyltransferase
MKIETRDLSPALWPQVENLFGAKGACGGCWCQAWRIEKGERWRDVQGSEAKERLRRGILDGTTLGVLAFDGETPIGWCTYGPRDSFPRLNRAPSLACDDLWRVWSVPCFFVRRDYRRKGAARALLDTHWSRWRSGGPESRRDTRPRRTKTAPTSPRSPGRGRSRCSRRPDSPRSGVGRGASAE